MKSRFAFKILATVGALGLASSALALSITPDSGTFNVSRWEGNQTGQPQIDAVIGGIIGNSTEQYKQNVGDGSDTGAFAGSYTTTFVNTPSDPSGALIHYVGSPAAVLPDTRYLLVKDGDQTPAWYLFNLSALGWNGTDDLVLSGFWPNQGAISHVALYTGTSGGPGVPDGGATIGLMGMSLVAVEILRRKLRKV
jgi:hypothetical protein